MKKKSKKHAFSTTEQWFIAKDDGRHCVKRFIKSKGRITRVQRLPIDQYRHLISNPKELERFVIRLNGRDPDEERAKELTRYRQAFLSSEVMTDYRNHFLPAHIPTPKDQDTMYRYLREYALDWFAVTRNLPNPLYWHRHQQEWGKYLLNDRNAKAFNSKYALFEAGERLSSKVIRQVVNELNRFMRYLHQQRPNEIPPLKFTPFSVATLKKHEADRQLSDEIRQSRYVNNDHWLEIVSALERKKTPWRHAVYLMHDYGLRRNEAFGLLPKDVRRGHISVERQLKAYVIRGEYETESIRKDKKLLPGKRTSPEDATIPLHRKKTVLKKIKIREAQFAPVKDRDQRRVPHWFVDAHKALATIQAANRYQIHPDTVTHEFALLMRELGLPPYTLKDLRRTWVTNSLRLQKTPEAVRLAAGHADIQTTYRHYVADIRELDDAQVESDGGAA